MRIGEIFSIERDGYPSSGYRWYLVHLENMVLITEDFQYQSTDCGKVGKRGKQIWTFQAVNEGTAKIQFAQYRTFAPDRVLYDEVLTYEITGETEANGIAGGWKPFGKPDKETVELLRSSIVALGVDYEPVLVTSQAVNGRAYLFLANAKAAAPEPVPYPVVIRIYAGTDGKGSVKEIKKLGYPGALGGFSEFGAQQPGSEDAFDEAFKHFVGMDFQCLAVSSQIVQGVNYLYAGNAKVQYSEAELKPVLAKVYKPLDGDARISNIKDAFEL